jgi:hypothetical protein
MFKSIYMLYGLVVLGAFGVSEYRGMSFTSYDEVKNVPKTVRDNPGAYRAHYALYHRYSGGK